MRYSKNLPNVFGIAYDILVAGNDIDGKDQDVMLLQVPYKYVDK